MALGFTVNVYGTVDQQPPYAADNNGGLASVQATYSAGQQANFPTAEVNIFGISPGVKMVGGLFCYGVIEVPPSGLQQFSKKYVVRETLATLASLRG